ncbi:MAG: tRNA (N6-isopentenyl adenosine(37)-C2)-methylthiotransferase MiaB [Candidatus Omnitrophica bacterium]|nr:tRNA (N6-isopentenyl adenosine(37)-C2)-methylthiotransferase MiaB [Candidatus Omnitrophota bacterium]
MPTRGNSNSFEKKKPVLYIRTFGCQMNVRDTEVISGLLLKAGFKLVEKPDNADIVILNTCSVRQHAEDVVWSEIGVHKNGKIIGLVGCMAQNYKEQAFQRAPNGNFVVGPSDIAKIPHILKDLLKDKGILERKIWETDGLNRPEEIYHTGYYNDKNHAHLVISEGCSNFCAYCVVPYVRGPERHRRFTDIIKEAEQALDKGINKITLLGQNVNSYKSENADFKELLKRMNAMKDLKEFSFLTSHPKDTDVKLFDAMASLDKLSKWLHLPLQSASDRILKSMKRNYTKDYFLDLTKEYRKIVKGGTLTTDVIVGFPGEAEKDFQETFDLLKKIRFDAAYIFKYSPRPGTEADRTPDDVPQKEKERRHRLILDQQRSLAKKNAKS